jgi:hypothetical protein
MRKPALLFVVVLACGLVGASTASAATPKLTKSQWGAYVRAHTPYVAQTAKTVAVFRKCRSSTAYTSYMKAFAACLGTSPAKEVAATTTLSDTLERFQGKVTGACAKALTSYQTALFFWKSVVVGIQRAVRIVAANVATVEAQVQNAILAAQRANAATNAFTKACKPLSLTA